ncbi:hypothetical protein [Nostoc sp. TCL26-01]|uniref:hypothetical protein n=1 Tax=Nostoc sp. TCL26-01 TaxID=2576904 RepID=UPI0015C0925F|nr:hypothetical protein [Nostoc sp. TCL26-01]QLE59623.1 hypothetical protein FD725_29660 [Nostoc sp. TCL26-01]QLE59635.1 hypothetical protein FD725_29730 [Nostoc sp. TCL26-01]
MLCPFCQHEAIKDEFTKANGCPACGYALDNFYAEPIKCSICNDEGHLTRSLYVQIFPERENLIPIEALYVACDCSLDREDDD